MSAARTVSSIARRVSWGRAAGSTWPISTKYGGASFSFAVTARTRGAAEEDPLDAELLALDELLDEERGFGVGQPVERGPQVGGAGDLAHSGAVRAVARLDHPGPGRRGEEGEGVGLAVAQAHGGLAESGGGEGLAAGVLGADPADRGGQVAGQAQPLRGLGDGDLGHLPYAEHDGGGVAGCGAGGGPVGGLAGAGEVDGGGAVGGGRDLGGRGEGVGEVGHVGAQSPGACLLQCPYGDVDAEGHRPAAADQQQPGGFGCGVHAAAFASSRRRYTRSASSWMRA